MGKVDPKKVEAVLSPVAAELGLEVVDIRFLNQQGRWVLQVLVDRAGGVTVGDCERFSREIETALEVQEVVPFRYSLEVSSPGLNRPLVKAADFLKFVGKKVAVTTAEPLNGRRNFKGTLQGCEQDQIRMMIDGHPFLIPLGAIHRAHVIYEGGSESCSKTLRG